MFEVYTVITFHRLATYCIVSDIIFILLAFGPLGILFGLILKKLHYLK